MDKQLADIGNTTPHVGTLDYATPATPSPGDEERKQAASSWIDGSAVDLSWVPLDGSSIGDAVGAVVEGAGTAGGAIAEAVGEIVGGLLEGISF